MPRPAPDAAVTLSVFDRLIDDDPRNSSEAPLTRAQSVRTLRNAVRRDLEWLLNTRQVAFPPPEGLRELNRSVYTFGLPDFTGFSLSSPAAEARLVRHLQTTLKFFEPRLAKVRVVPLEPLVGKTRTFRFRIEALLLMDPAPEHISFDTVLQLTTSQYEVQDAG
ncbi:MAG TPA: type VI secretion system baseplate subunit TssE [Dongiaceae bacterium]|jgi:type VI secretion system protein ImpF|nr:type VI secretion system baseplate subunit TssE [Dongiaceae bacterium]